MAAGQGSRGCCSWLCCCCCCCRKQARETSPLLSSGGGGGKKEAAEPAMSRLQVVASADGQSETQQLELSVHESSHEEEEEEEMVQPATQKEERRSRTTSVSSHEPPVRDPATTTTFVRGSSGRSSWRMVPHPKRLSQISVKEEDQPEPSAAVVTADETGEGTPEPVAMAPETPPPPPKDYTLITSYEDDKSEPSDEGEEEREMVHTSSFSFTARDGQVKSTQ